MGVCHCVEMNNNCLNNEIDTQGFKISEVSSINVIKKDYDEDLIFVKNIKNQENNYSKFIAGKNKKNNRSLIYDKINTINKSEILFENFSYVSNTNDQIDYYQNSKIMFDFINSIRLNPIKYVNSINNVLNEFNALNEELNGKENLIKVETENQNNFSSSNYNLIINEQIINYLKDEHNYNNVLEIKEYLNNIVENKNNNKTDLIIWSEKVYLTAYEYLIEVEEKPNANLELIKKSSSHRVSEKLKMNSFCMEFNLNGLYPSDITVLFLLLENKERLKNILLDNYSYGAICQFPSRVHKVRTLFYFVYKNRKLPLIMGINPLTKLSQNLTLDEPLFSKLDYKHLITEGAYESDGKDLTVKFTLVNGIKKKEIFNLN